MNSVNACAAFETRISQTVSKINKVTMFDKLFIRHFVFLYFIFLLSEIKKTVSIC